MLNDVVRLRLGFYKSNSFEEHFAPQPAYTLATFAGPADLDPVKGVKKQHLPEKVCIVCRRPFAWRKKRERVWDEVKLCSDRCRKMKGAPHSV